MKIENGMKCKYKPFNEMVTGTVVSASEDGNEFIVTDSPACKVPQYDDSRRYFTKEDIGKSVFFEAQA